MKEKTTTSTPSKKNSMRLSLESLRNSHPHACYYVSSKESPSGEHLDNQFKNRGTNQRQTPNPHSPTGSGLIADSWALSPESTAAEPSGLACCC
jgi:hypothetical protein